MPKLKTLRSAAKRFKKTASGKIKRKKAYASHIMTKKTPKRKRALRTATLITGSDQPRIKKMIPYA
ncbi:MAG: 50S ribosomal protein L35 [Candidatus Glassbacteria bacterium RIFCSPLOWO2_12_FULL_58_11]|uniref:Large ribosomal subunit protein bL35 n=2 Tax=Candidatus Glassiibacteriota TaxID=1817805 RepID=A0A1F5Z368_9BACT|nr:MAG: 50S ribosomal protein L35 [Candidatus Glassbacteria bacterium GWA2_58_10]OGG06881.1 MAG: 50S ribosomal protein L35 [Candidatus Glassbacteria bacterium RIFCSPLOWO2_12_FULL_58_11]